MLPYFTEKFGNDFGPPSRNQIVDLIGIVLSPPEACQTGHERDLQPQSILKENDDGSQTFLPEVQRGGGGG